MAYEYQYGSTEIEMQTLRALGIRAAPQPGYRPYATTIKLGDNTIKGQGFPIVTWHSGFITVAERGIFLAGMGSNLTIERFIRTRLPNDTWATFQCLQNIPTGEENLSVGKIIGFDIVFTECVLIV